MKITLRSPLNFAGNREEIFSCTTDSAELLPLTMGLAIAMSAGFPCIMPKGKARRLQPSGLHLLMIKHLIPHREWEKFPFTTKHSSLVLEKAWQDD
jgi:hypothetical protein